MNSNKQIKQVLKMSMNHPYYWLYHDKRREEFLSDDNVDLVYNTVARALHNQHVPFNVKRENVIDSMVQMIDYTSPPIPVDELNYAIIQFLYNYFFSDAIDATTKSKLNVDVMYDRDKYDINFQPPTRLNTRRPTGTGIRFIMN
jgi:hypothetical protein